MPATKLRSLYLGSKLSDLKAMFQVNMKGKNPKLLCMTATKLHEKAVLENIAGDQEQSYVDFMKYLEVVTFVQNSDEFKKDPTFYKNMFGTGNIRDALNEAERLQKSLERRYELIKEKAEIDAALLEQERKEAEEEERKRAEKAMLGKVGSGQGEAEIADVSEVSLSSSRLFTLLNDKKIKMLIMDARPAGCFAASHMTIGHCISIPEEIIRAGASASALEKLLPEDSKALFGQRKAMDIIILIDWTTTASTLTPGSHLYTLKNILLKWDPNVIYKYHPLIVDGGYDDWLQRYPMFTSNPRAKPPQTYDSSLDDLLLDNIEYPSWNESKPAEVSSPGSLRPGINRASKAAALQTYEERNKSVRELLEASEQGADSSLALERDLLRAEKEREGLRAKKEMEAEGEMKAQLQEREELLMMNIARLEGEQKRKEDENQSLRVQLEEYRKRDAQDASHVPPQKTQDADINRRIHDKEAEAKALAKQREEIAKDRLRKVNEDRQKRKIEEQKKREIQRLEKLKLDRENGTSYAPLEADRSSSANMKRSHSSPNIAQLVNDDYGDDDGAMRTEAPQFDRAVKPLQKPQRTELNAARQRDFMGVLGRPPAQGLTGLKNLGNTCYMNSIIQCISNTRELRNYFVSGDYREDVNHYNKTRGEVVEEVAAVVRALWGGEYRYVACRDLKNAVGHYKEVFRGNQQQDSHEFLFFLINWLHDDLNKRNGKSKLADNVREESLSDSAKQWREFERCNLSLIQALFYGQQKSRLHCLTCGKESSTYAEFNHLSLPLPDHNGRCNIEDCLRLYLNGDRVSGWNCPACKQPRDAIMKFDIIRLPPILVIHLKRFYHDGWSRKKVNLVDFPLTELDMQTFTPGLTNSRGSKYQLYGVSNHYGTMEGGHYTAYCKNSSVGRWFKFDDNEVINLDHGDVKSSAAYILFYTSVNYNNKQNAR